MSRITVSTLVFGLIFVLNNCDGFPVEPYLPLLHKAVNAYNRITTSELPDSIGELNTSDRNLLTLLVTVPLVAAKKANGQDLDAAYKEVKLGETILYGILKKVKHALVLQPVVKAKNSLQRGLDFCSRAHCEGIANTFIRLNLVKYHLPGTLPSLVLKALDEYLKIQDILWKDGTSSLEELKPLILAIADILDGLKKGGIDGANKLLNFIMAP